MANVSERCEISRQTTPGALYWAAREPSEPWDLAVYWQLLSMEHKGICALKANGQTPGGGRALVLKVGQLAETWVHLVGPQTDW